MIISLFSRLHTEFLFPCQYAADLLLIPMSNNNEKAHHNGQSGRLPRKRFYRARAHSNPLSDSHFPIPICPSEVDYAQHFPHFFPSVMCDQDKCDAPVPKVRFADIGCGFGGLLVSLSTLFPDVLMIGMELRDKVNKYDTFVTYFLCFLLYYGIFCRVGFRICKRADSSLACIKSRAV